MLNGLAIRWRPVPCAARARCDTDAVEHGRAGCCSRSARAAITAGRSALRRAARARARRVRAGVQAVRPEVASAA